MDQDQVFVPKTRSEVGLPPLNADKEDLQGSKIAVSVMNEFKEALGDSPIGAMWGAFSYLVSNTRVLPCIMPPLANAAPPHSS